MVDKYVKGELLELAFLAVYVAFVLGALSLAIGFGFGGFELSEVLAKNNFYIPYGIIFLVGIIALKVTGIFLFGKKDAKIEGSVVHDPEQSPIGGFKVIKNPFLLAYLSLIVFALLGWLAVRTQTFFSEIPKYEQQFTKGADLFFSIYPASPAETLGAIFLISITGLVLGYFLKKGKLGKMTFLFLFIPIGSVVSMLYGIINHLARYGNSDIALINVAFFWFFGGLITTITGSMIPFLVMHDVNNFFYRLSKLFSSDIVTFITFTSIGILVVLFFIVLFRIKNKKVKELDKSNI